MSLAEAHTTQRCAKQLPVIGKIASLARGADAEIIRQAAIMEKAFTALAGSRAELEATSDAIKEASERLEKNAPAELKIRDDDQAVLLSPAIAYHMKDRDVYDYRAVWMLSNTKQSRLTDRCRQILAVGQKYYAQVLALDKKIEKIDAHNSPLNRTSEKLFNASRAILAGDPPTTFAGVRAFVLAMTYASYIAETPTQSPSPAHDEDETAQALCKLNRAVRAMALS